MCALSFFINCLVNVFYYPPCHMYPVAAAYSLEVCPESCDVPCVILVNSPFMVSCDLELNSPNLRLYDGTAQGHLLSNTPV